MNYLERIQAPHLDILKEVGNIGAGHAATALSKMLNKSIDMAVPSVKIVHLSEVSEFVGGDEMVVAAIFLRLQGDAPGNMFFMLPLEEATRLIQQVTDDYTISSGNLTENEIGMSALCELGNILAGSYLSALSDFTSLNLQPTPPALAIDMAMAILSHGLIEVSKAGDYAIVIDTKISDKDDTTQSKGHFFLLPDPESFKIIFHSLGVKIDE
ncbi:MULTISPECIES: chemotaxis protein CheC [Bacillaceae]|uniref:Chemotaxis protein CheC n=1 Tax=Evansella alkalicola TaxID=745819 RepID=A0ABS6JSV7_9BACI|nr:MULTISPECIES: chemotaxis protein CheC [Bacillaceae]MBU9720342.1 chemotaxis protein CheC [Bacillus alkalicola]